MKVGVYSCGITAPFLSAFVNCPDPAADPCVTLSCNFVFYASSVSGPFTVPIGVTAQTMTGTSVPGVGFTVSQK